MLAKSAFMLSLTLLGLATGQACATTKTWTLQNVTFADGGTGSGSFDYDADMNAFSSINIATSGGSTGFSATYGVLNGTGTATQFSFASGLPLTGQSQIKFDLSAALTNAGGIIPLVLFSSLEALCATNDCGTVSLQRGISQGTLSSPTTSPVPVPSALPLLASGLGALGYIGWRSKRKATA